ncbi:MAG: plastocyanin/azurin family copper-binding protein [Pseudomarimonas sp.]
MRSVLLRAMTVMCVLWVADATAREHVVDVVSFRFAPAEIEVAAGDTVVWRNQDGLHNVLADNGAFSSGAPRSDLWTYRYTFTQPGDYNYYCTEHGSAGRRGMAGVVRVTGAAPSFVPGRFTTGTWFSPALDGQGFTFEWLAASNQIAFGWFTFAATSDAPAWFYGLAPLDGAIARAPLTSVRGGRFVLATPIELLAVGELVLTFHTCNEATATWRRDDLNQHGSLALQRLTPGDPLCESTGVAAEESAR